MSKGMGYGPGGGMDPNVLMAMMQAGGGPQMPQNTGGLPQQMPMPANTGGLPQQLPPDVQMGNTGGMPMPMPQVGNAGLPPMAPQGMAPGNTAGLPPKPTFPDEYILKSGPRQEEREVTKRGGKKFDDWWDDNIDEIEIMAAETGADREMDYDLEEYARKVWAKRRGRDFRRLQPEVTPQETLDEIRRQQFGNEMAEEESLVLDA